MCQYPLWNVRGSHVESGITSEWFKGWWMVELRRQVVADILNKMAKKKKLQIVYE